jgi:hypothetical protein
METMNKWNYTSILYCLQNDVINYSQDNSKQKNEILENYRKGNYPIRIECTKQIPKRCSSVKAKERKKQEDYVKYFYKVRKCLNIIHRGSKNMNLFKYVRLIWMTFIHRNMGTYPTFIILLTNNTTMGLSPSWEAARRSATRGFLHIFGTWRFIVMFTGTHHWFYPEPDQSNLHHPILFLFILILPSHLHLGPPSSLFPQKFSTLSIIPLNHLLCCIAY